MSAPFDVVLFDLGGVLVDFGGVQAMKELSGITDDDELWHRWLTCRWVREFERGGWKYKRVSPLGEDWIEAYWRVVVRKLLKS